MRYIKQLIICTFIIGLFILPAIVQCKVPEKKEVTVYSLNLWDGKSYSSTFSPEEVEKIYVIANKPSVFSVRKTEVYYWPITKEYKANWFEKNELVKGTMEVLQNDKVIKKNSLQNYSFLFPEGQFSDKIEIFIGNKADQVYVDFKKEQEQYYKKVQKYYEEQQKYEEKIKEWLEKKKEDKEILEDNLPKIPEQPEPFQGFITEPQQAFILNLEKGNYRIRVKNEKGEVISGTEKELMVFTNRRSGIGYQVLSEEKWTYPETSNELEDILYMEGEQVFFFKPYNAEEYPEKGYAKLSSLHKPETDRLSEDRWRWVYLTGRTDDILQIVKNGHVVEEVTANPYYVKQSPGYALGYEIIEWDESVQSPPTFTGYKVNINVDGQYTIIMLDKEKNIIQKGIRVIRPIKENNTCWLFVVALLPFILGMGITIWKRRLKSDKIL